MMMTTTPSWTAAKTAGGRTERIQLRNHPACCWVMCVLTQIFNSLERTKTRNTHAYTRITPTQHHHMGIIGKTHKAAVICIRQSNRSGSEMPDEREMCSHLHAITKPPRLSRLLNRQLRFCSAADSAQHRFARTHNIIYIAYRSHMLNQSPQQCVRVSIQTHASTVSLI